MKLLLAVLFFYSFTGIAGTINLEVRVIDITNDTGLEEVKIRLGYQADYAHIYSGDYTSLSIQDLSKEDLTDTLFIHSIGYSFEFKPLIEHNYTVSEYGGDLNMIVFVYGVPHITSYTLDLPIAKSRKSVMDSIDLKIYMEKNCRPTSLKLLNNNGDEMIRLNDSWKETNCIDQSIMFSNLQDGYFEMEVNEQIKRYPFYKTDCLQPIYLSTITSGREQELAVLESLKDMQKSHENIVYQLNDNYTRKISELNDRVDSLEKAIYILKYGPILDLSPPEMEEELPIADEQVNFYVKDKPAQPIMGIPAFLEQLKGLLMEHTVKKSGIVYIKLSIGKYGEVEFICSHFEQQITNTVVNYLSYIQWDSYKLWGKPIHSNIEIYLNFYKKE